MQLQESVSLKSKTTMRIGGRAKYYADIFTKEELQETYQFAKEHSVPLIVLGGGSNTVFAEGEINAFVIRIKADHVDVAGTQVSVAAGKSLAMLLNELAEKDLDLSTLTGIPGTVGGAVFGNAGQGAGGIWMDTFIQSVTIFIDGEWKEMTKEECDFRYRESWFKDQTQCHGEPVILSPSSLLRINSVEGRTMTPIIWSATLTVPRKPKKEVQAEIERLLQRRLETQPHVKTAGSCFKSLPDGTPAWKLIDAKGLRGLQIGGIQVSEKHANFLLNIGEGNLRDLLEVTEKIKEQVPEIAEIEMRLFGEDGQLL